MEMTPDFQITFWYWWILGVALLGLELAVPGIVFLWVGMAAGVVGFIVLPFPGLSWESQVLLFALLSLAVTVAGRIWWKRRGQGEGDPTLNRRGAGLVGSRCVLETGLVNGRGRARVGDGTWTVSGPDLPAGTAVRVTAVDGNILVVEAV
jgi:membrane protein implicated in regulation of membrane protease activity